MEKIVFEKNHIRDYVKNVISAKIEKLKNFIEFTLEASRDIKKTPKYDSMREEMQEEIYQMQKQLGALHDLKRNMSKVLNNATDKVQLGSLVITNKATFLYFCFFRGILFRRRSFLCYFPRKSYGEKNDGHEIRRRFYIK
jgi:hypothetical protein